MYTWARKTIKQVESNRGVIQSKTRQQKPMRPPYMTGGTITNNRYISQLNNNGLPDNLKEGIENLSGMAMDDVRVHYNSSLPDRYDALAYTQGRDIHLARGREQYLPHEAWHAVQQKQGRVNPTMSSGNAHINDSQSLETEADRMGTKSLQLPGYQNTGYANPGHSTNNAGVLQLMRKFMGFVNMDGNEIVAWWDDQDGLYYPDENATTPLAPQPRSERYYAEGPGTHALNIAGYKSETLVKASEYMSKGQFSGDWKNKYDAVVKNMPFNMKFDPGGGKGNVLTVGKWTGSTSGRTTTRKHDLLQLTFPRGGTKMSGNQAQIRTAQAEDAQIVLGFLKTAALRVKPGGEMKVILMESPFYTNYMDRNVIHSPELANHNIQFINKDVLGTKYQDQPQFSQSRRPNLKYEHLITQSASAPPDRPDAIYTFKLIR